MKTSLNQMTTPALGYGEFLDLARKLGCIGVEVRNDLGRPLFDGIAPEEAGKMARDRGLRILGVSQVYPFNSWSDAIAAEVRDLIVAAKAAGGETISLIPRNDGTCGANGERQANLRIALREIKPMLEEAGMVALVEPLGFMRSSLREKAELVEAIDDLDARHVYKLVHDTFHHTLSDGGPMFADYTGIVHISGVVNPDLNVGQMEDEHRVLVDDKDRLGNIEQIAALYAAGYDGAISYECFSPETHALKDPEREIRVSFDFIASQLAEMAD
ncbi:TIM barrel protein [Celeribacter sp. SCSIO 80788]|uniref:TIM barrel protein n=1 Tax=Celeribacter sp. SCSIO 80788 TaxID=3117013 RepID=UPI003DA60CF7